MATIADLNVRIGATFADLEKGLRGAERALQRSGQRFSNLGNELSIAITAPLGALGVASIKTAGDIEALTLALEAQLGSAQAAREEFAKLQKVALQPGIALEQAVKGSVSLQAVGLSAEKARDVITQFGNGLALAGRSGQDLDGVVLALTQISAKGKVTAEEINQIAERLPQIRTLLKDAFGTADTEQLQKLGVTSAQFIDAITTELSKLPRATGGIKNAIDNTGDSIKQFLATIGQEINKAFDLVGLSEKLSSGLRTVAQAFAGLDNETKKFIVSAGVGLVALGPLVKLFGVFQLSIAGSINALRALVPATKPIALLFSGLTNSTQGLVAFTQSYTKALLGAEIAAVRFRIAVLAATGGLILVLGGIAAAVFLLSDRFDAAKFAAEQFAEAQKNVTEETARETAELNKNFAVLQNTNSTYTDRQKAISELQRVYPEYLRGIDLEKASNAELEQIQKRVNRAILQGVAERQKSAAVTKIYEEQAKLLLRIQELQDGANVTVKESTLIDTGDLIKAGSRSAAVIEKLQQQVAGLSDQAAKSAAQFDKAFGLQNRAIDLNAQKLADQRQANQDAEERALALAEAGIFLNDITEDNTKTVIAATDATNKETEAIEKKIKAFRALGDLQKIEARPDSNLRGQTIQGIQSDPNIAAPDLSLGALADGLTTINELTGSFTAQLATVVTPAQALFEGMSEKVLTFGETWKGLGDIIAENGSIIGQTAFALGDAIAQTAASGSASFAELASAALAAGKQIISIAIKEGVAFAIANALKGSPFALANPLAAVALAGAAGVAASALFSGILGKVKIPALATGGITTGPQLAMVGDNPGGKEAIIPLNRLPSLLSQMGGGGNGYIAETRISGQDLLLVVKKAEVTNTRITGKR